MLLWVQRILIFVAAVLLFTTSSPRIHAQSISFQAYGLKDIAGSNYIIQEPTSLQFGPDGRLYVSEQSGTIHVLTITRETAPAIAYKVTAAEQINLIRNIPNHDDDGVLNLTLGKRQVTGLLVVGTATNPIIYVSSSDPRISVAFDSNLDTNSGIVSRLTWNGSSWDKIDLVRGLPRNEENHSTNGMQLDTTNNILYVSQGGHSNMGAPDRNFSYQPEYALSAAILTVDLNVIDALPTLNDPNSSSYKYDLPTIDDDTRANSSGTFPNGIDLYDPFGGNNGNNMAVIVPGGPVQVYASGFRNPYDVLLASNGKIYTIDNGPNVTWGGIPIGEGPGGNCTNQYNAANSATYFDGFHYVSGAGYYGGHPNPIRANPDGAKLWDVDTSTNPPTETEHRDFTVADSPVPFGMADPQQCDYRQPGVENGALDVFLASTNGLAEYQASNFSGEMQGDLLAASFNGTIYRLKLTPDGTGLVDLDANPGNYQSLLTGFGSVPLDVTTQGDTQIFPGTIWAATYGSDAITIFEPVDFQGCTGAYDPALDEDGDNFDNADEIDNNTDPCSAGSTPDDFDGDFESDLNDPDDDNDGINDPNDVFARDATNGSNTAIPLLYGWAAGDPGFGMFGLGFTGLMANGTTDYLDQYDPTQLTAGGASGKFTVDTVTDGDATTNDQDYAFQFGIDISSTTLPFTVRTRLESPFFGGNPQGNQSFGFYIGTGEQDNYLKAVLHANNGAGGIEIAHEIGGVANATMYTPGSVLTPASVDLYLSVNPATGMVQPRFSLNSGIDVFDLGSPIAMPTSWFNGTQAMAVGVISTSQGAAPTFGATWDFLEVTIDPITSVGTWEIINATGSPTGRHEHGFVQVAGKFYMVGGRETNNVDIYDPATNAWTSGTPAPTQLHHMQLVTLDGLIYVIGASFGGCCNELGVPNVYIYDPLADQWTQGADIPTNRQRGSVGTVIYNDKFYLFGGLQNGDSQIMVDRYDPATNTWITLPDMISPRDHFHATLAGSTVYLVGGRAGVNGGPIVPPPITRIDYYDLDDGTGGVWSSTDPPGLTPRSAAGTVLLGNEIVLIGGETPFQAFDTTEAFDVTTQTWRTLASLNQGRHGTQATLCNENIYVMAGSPQPFGGNTTIFERFYYDSPNNCPATALTPGSLAAAPNTVDFGTVVVGGTKVELVTITNPSPNQATIITNIQITGSTTLSHSFPYTLPIHLAPGASINIDVHFDPDTEEVVNGELQVTSSNSATPLSVPLTGQGVTANPPLYRVNAGGSQLPAADASLPDWGEDSLANPSTYMNGSNNTYIVTDPITLGSSVPAAAPVALFQSHRWDLSTPPPMEWEFPAPAADYEVRLYFAETYAPAATVGGRVFDVYLEDILVLDDYDIFADVGYLTGHMIPFVVTSDGVIDLDFAHITQNPAISGIEIIPLGSSGNLPPIAQDDSYTVDQAGTLTVPAPGVLENDIDPDSSTFIVTEIDPPDHGVLNYLNNDGSFEYVHNGDFATVDTFEYEICDPTALCDSATVTININQLYGSITVVKEATPESPQIFGFSGDLGDFTLIDDGTNPNTMTFDTLLPNTYSVTEEDTLGWQLDNIVCTGASSSVVGTTAVILIAAGDQATCTFYNSQLITATPTPTPTGTLTITATNTATPTPTLTSSETPTPTATLDGSATATLTVTATNSATPTPTPPNEQVIYRVNIGGPELSASDGSTLNWSEDSNANPSPYVNAGSDTYSVTNPITLDNTVPQSAPEALFQSQRWDPSQPPEMEWEFPVTPGDYEVRLLFAEIYPPAGVPGGRLFDVYVEDVLVLDNYDIFDIAGLFTGHMESIPVTSDDVIDIDFTHMVQNPSINGIEIVAVSGSGTATPTATVSVSPTSTTTPTNTATSTSSPSPTNTATSSPTNTPTALPTDTPTGTPTNTPTAIPSSTNTPTPTDTPTAVPTSTDTPAPTNTATSVPTNTPTAVPTSTNTPLPTDTATAVPTNTATTVPTNTPTAVPTSTNTPLPTDTATTVPTSTNTPAPTNTATAIPSSTNTPLPTDTATAVLTNTNTPVPTNTATAVPTSTNTPLPTDTPTAVPTNTATSVPTDTATVVPTATPTNTPLPTNTPTTIPTSTNTPAPTNTATAVLTNTNTPVLTHTPINTPLPTNTLTTVPTNTSTPVPTNTATAVPTSTNTPVPTNTPTTVPTSTATTVQTSTNTPASTNTAIAVPTNTATSVPTATPTNTPLPTSTNTPVPTDTPTTVPTNTATGVPTHTPTNTPIPTNTATAIPISTSTPTAVPTNTATSVPTHTPTNTPLPTNTATAIPTSMNTSVPTDTATTVPTSTPTVVPTSSNTPISTSTPTAVPTNTATSVPTHTPTNTPIPTNTPTVVPTNTNTPVSTAVPTSTPPPTSTIVLPPTATSTLVASHTPTPSSSCIGGQYDLSDAPPPYIQVEHILNVGDKLQLGNTITPDCVNQVAGFTDLDDGINSFPTIKTNDQQVTLLVSVVNTTQQSATLYGWIDFNGDQRFQNGRELARINVPAGTQSSVELVFDVPNQIIAGDTWARFRITSNNALPLPNRAPDGEVEDYPVTITTGDIQTNEPTQVATNEATPVPPSPTPSDSGNNGGNNQQETPVAPQPTGESENESALAQVPTFQPEIEIVGILEPNNLGNIGSTLEWLITIRNTSPVTGTNLIINSSIDDILDIATVRTNRGTATVNGQIITVTLASLAPGETIDISVNTTIITSNAQAVTTVQLVAEPDVEVENTGVITLLTIRTLPETGETPTWRNILLILSALGIVVISRRLRQRQHLRQ